MLDQLFSAENFRRIFDIENRKGNDLVSQYFPHLVPLTLDIKAKASEIREYRKSEANVSAEEFKLTLNQMKAELNELKSNKSSSIDTELEAISAQVSNSGFKLSLTKKAGPQGKDIYLLDNTAATFFCRETTTKQHTSHIQSQAIQ